MKAQFSRGENSLQPTRALERRMQGFRRPERTQGLFSLASVRMARAEKTEPKNEDASLVPSPTHRRRPVADGFVWRQGHLRRPT